jgi:predicted dehydrogenase
MKLTRRDFTRLSALAALSTTLPLRAEAADGHEGRRLRWCIVGLGRISMGQFMPGLRLSRTGTITALVSGHRKKAEKQAALYGVKPSSIYSYESFDEIRHNKDIDAVYIALPNSMHAEYTIRAAKAGKHVLCEKPMATSLADCHAMIQACRKANVKLMIAYRCQYHPSHLKAIELIRSGAVGKVMAIEGAFGFDIAPGEWRLNKKMAGGGPLMDVGIYSLNAARYLTGENPTQVKGYASVIDHDGRFTQVEESDGWTMKFPSEIVASCSTSYGAQMDGFFRVHASQGWIYMNGFNYSGMHLTAGLASGEKLDIPDPVREPGQFTAEADYFADCVWNGREPKTDGAEGLRDMVAISRIYESAGLRLGV